MVCGCVKVITGEDKLKETLFDEHLLPRKLCKKECMLFYEKRSWSVGKTDE